MDCDFNISRETDAHPMKAWLMRAMSAISRWSATLFVGFNTVEGAGRDVEEAGEKVRSEMREVVEDDGRS